MSRRRPRLLSCLLGGALGLAGAPAALACSIAGPELHNVDPDEVLVDVEAPAQPTGAALGAVRRGRGPQCDATGVCMSTSCDDIGTLQLSWTPGGDDRTLDDELGVILRVVEGEAPGGMWPLDEVVVPGAAGHAALVWVDGADDRQEALDFVLAISEVDRAGNESAPVELRIQLAGSGAAADDSEDEGRGCSVAGGAAGLLVLLPVVGILAGRRREH